MKNKKILIFILVVILSLGTYSVKADRIERRSSATVKIRRELGDTGIYIGTSDKQMPLNVFDVSFNGGTYFGVLFGLCISCIIYNVIYLFA